MEKTSKLSDAGGYEEEEEEEEDEWNKWITTSIDFIFL